MLPNAYRLVISNLFYATPPSQVLKNLTHPLKKKNMKTFLFYQLIKIIRLYNILWLLLKHTVRTLFIITVLSPNHYNNQSLIFFPYIVKYKFYFIVTVYASPAIYTHTQGGVLGRKNAIDNSVV